MKCPDSEALLQRRLDGEAVADRATLDHHLAGCAACRERFAAAARLLDEGLPALARSSPPPFGWSGRVVAALLAEHRRRRWRLVRRVALASAAAVLLALASGWYLTPGLPPDGKAPETQVRHEPKPAETETKTSLRQTVAEAERAVKALTNRIADNTVEQVRTLIAVSAPADVGPMPTLPTAAALEQPFDPATRSLRETGRGVSTGIQTVAGSARRAFDFLMRELPPVAP